MNCQEFWESYPELAVGDVGGHSRECPACARLLAEQQALAAGLRAAAVEGRRVEAPASVEASLLVAFRGRQRSQPKPHRLWLPVLTWASAAALLIVLATLAFRGREPVSPPRTSHRAVQVAALPAADWDSDYDSNIGDFIPLPNAQQVGENEDVNVVRVEVPRSAMLAVGLPVSMDRVSELVEADVMLGADGLARAVRFVNE